MAFPRWLTPAGNLGVVPELEYYEFPLDAYDENLFAFSGNITANSKVISHVTNLDGIVKGQGITGIGRGQRGTCSDCVRHCSTPCVHGCNISTQ